LPNLLRNVKDPGIVQVLDLPRVCCAPGLQTCAYHSHTHHPVRNSATEKVGFKVELHRKAIISVEPVLCCADAPGAPSVADHVEPALHLARVGGYEEVLPAG
jgi:hypothetical protein